ncbi:MAG: SDR family NAD(P)-dependent oxidoreductase, partial [Hamadaea sp.]|nr:SDR family NAD(P)-dependent oxidoreductase [Hamadaea sp.]
MSENILAPVPVRLPLPAALAGRTVVVVGGSSGIGLAAGELLASVGADVVLAARDGGRLAAADERVKAAGGTVRGVTGDG